MGINTLVKIVSALLFGTTVSTLVACRDNGSTPTIKPTETQGSTYELAIDKLGYQTAQHWKGVALNDNSKQAINELVFLPEEGRLVLAEDINAYTSEKTLMVKSFLI